MKNISANTFTPIYDQVEDRLRLVINYQDIQSRVDFMITRSFILNLIPAAEEFIDKHYPDEILLNDTTVKTNFNVQENTGVSKTDNTNLELLRTQEELLLEVNFSFDINTKQTVITFSSKNVIAKAVLDSNTMQQTISVIKSSIPYIQWGFSHNF
ncbi:MAG: hypothetical protein U9P72_03660 [Campylobacterota bacterium]|nr:hypothetical protein [Campylobacterota bacterium]